LVSIIDLTKRNSGRRERRKHGKNMSAIVSLSQMRALLYYTDVSGHRT
jgi:hypothetical protein